jgi:ADP-heptose:LPS heptosyltransferase
LAIGKTVKIDETSDYAAYKKFLNSVNDNFELPQHADQIKQEILRITDIIICPGASSVKKRYPIEGYLRLYKDLLNSFNNIKFVIGPSEPDITPYLIDNGVAQKDIYNDLQANEFVNLIQHSKLVISNDSMAAHISNLTGTTLLCLAWGVRYNRFIKYLEKNNTVLSYPCEYRNCDACVFHDQRKYQCIKSLKYENIFNDALRLMNV